MPAVTLHLNRFLRTFEQNWSPFNNLYDLGNQTICFCRKAPKLLTG
jgi:hypothetical protein